MKPTLSRRDFLTCSVAGAALSAVGAAQTRTPVAPVGAATGEAAGLTVYQLGPQIWVRLDNRLLTCYRGHRSQKYPYLYPVTGPLSGLSLTSETALPWPHHRSLFFGCDRVNGGNYWQEGYEQGQILSSGPKVGAMNKESVEILDTCDWQKPGGPVVMKDQRRIVVRVRSARLWLIDWEIQWQAVENVIIQKTNHSLFSLRAASDLTPIGGGRLVNAEGASGEKATFGKRSSWCGFCGSRAGLPIDLVEGIALLDHPRNPWAPTPWFTRDYGFLSPTPMNFLAAPWELAAGRSVTLRYRVVAHGGDPQAAGLDRLYRDWVDQA
jgi:hypothetical protein